MIQLSKPRETLAGLACYLLLIRLEDSNTRERIASYRTTEDWSATDTKSAEQGLSAEHRFTCV